MPNSATPSQISDLLTDARKSIQLPRELDISGRIAAANLAYGLARLRSAVRTLCPDGHVEFSASPDFTITRTVKRWNGGFAYGGLFELHTPGMELVVPELRPNACGVLVVRLELSSEQTNGESDLDAHQLVQRTAQVRAESNDLVWDYSRRNHFLNLYVDAQGRDKYFILHGCPARIRYDTEDGPGMDVVKSPYWQARLERVETPLGPVDVLLGDDARAFVDNFRRCEAISLQDRVDTAARIFGNFETVRNISHVGMTPSAEGVSGYYHGCHVVDDDGLYPVLTRPDAPAYMVSAPSHGGRTRRTLLPHGTGYHLELPEQLEITEDPSGTRPIFLLRDPETGAVQAYSDFASVPFSYRSERLVETWQEQGLLRIEQTLELAATVKL